MSATTAHHVWVLFPGWSHHTSAHAVIFRSLELNPALKITLQYHVLLKSRVEEDIRVYPQHLLSRLTIVSCGSPDIVGSVDSVQIMMQELEAGFKDMLSTLKSPTKFILDTMVAMSSHPLIKDAFPEAKSYLWWSPSAACLYSFVAPAPHGGADYKEIVDRYIEDGSKDDRNALIEMVGSSTRLGARTGALECNGTVVQVPGLPEMYDYEREQSNLPTPPGFLLGQTIMVDLLKVADGVLTASSQVLEGAAIDASKAFTDVISPGIAVSVRAWNGSDLKEGSVKVFMDKQAEKSVLIISFGSLFFPSAHIETVVETLLELKQPFVLVAGSASGGKLSDELAHKVEASETGLYHFGWFDQISLLSHRATGWLMCHAGWNSICEALVRSVPLITWPFLADQPFNAALISTGTPQLGFELLEGKALKPTKRGVDITGTPEAVRNEVKEVIAKAFRGDEGRKIRQNVEAMRQALKQEHEGLAKERLLEFVTM